MPEKTIKSYLIGYDLDKPDQDYANLIKAIMELSDKRWHCLDSTWIIKSDKTTIEIRDELKRHIGKSDKLLVATFTGEGAWAGFENECSGWLKEHL